MATKSEQQEEEPKAVPKKKRKALKRAILICIILALGAGGYMGWRHMTRNAKSTPAHARPQKRIVYELHTFLVNLADPGGQRYLKVNIRLEVSSPEVVKELNAEKYKFRDMILMLLTSKRFADISTLSGKIALKLEIVSRLNGALAKGRVKQVYFTQFLVQ